VPGCKGYETTSFYEALAFIEEHKPDIVHDHSCWSLESPVRLLKNQCFISTTHVNHAIGWTKNVVYLSKAQRDQHAIQTHHNIYHSPIVRVPTSPTLKPQGLPKLDYLLYLGSVAEHKGVVEAAQVAAYLHRPLIVAGIAAGEYADKVANMPYVRMVGEVSDPYRSNLIEQAHAVMCLHNNDNGWSEPGCGVVGEAGALNTPVAALKNGCLPEIVLNHVNGWIADTVAAVGYMMRNEPYLTDVSHPARVDWSAENIIKQYLHGSEPSAEGANSGLNKRSQKVDALLGQPAEDMFL
jgi:glycosyltransferase involved in cell wall biosynthesis